MPAPVRPQDETRQLIVEYLNSTGRPMTWPEIASAVGITAGYRTQKRMLDAGQIQNAGVDASDTALYTVSRLPDVRILPMNAEIEFNGQSTSDVQQQFFLDGLPNRTPGGMYYYRSPGLTAELGTVVLFQYYNQIIASAKFQRAEKFDEPIGNHNGALYFDADSIRVFDPLGPEVVQQIWPTFESFGNVKQSLDANRYPEFEKHLTGVRWPPFVVPTALDLESPPADRIQTMISRIIRDSRQALRIKQLHNYECQICGYVIMLADGSRYAEAHHVQPLGKPHNGPDIAENIICVCPNHHAMCDLAAIQLDLNELHAVDGHQLSAKYVDYHNQLHDSAVTSSSPA